MKPLVSILVPAFNAQEWIADTLGSAIAQTWERTEIIVVDDGSSDQTLAVARQFESKDVRVVSQKNQGAASARNKAFSLCQGDYIQWLDADDLLAPNKVALQMEVSGRCPSKRTLLSSEWGRFLYRPHRARFAPTALWRNLSPVDWLLCKMEQNVYMQTSTWLVSRELSEAAGSWNTRLLGDDDGEYFCRVLLQSDGVRFVPDAKVYYRECGAGGLSYVGHSDRKMEALWRSMLLHIDYLRSMEDSERARAACVKYLQTLLIFFYPERLDIAKQAEQMARNLGGELEFPRLSWKYSWIRATFGWPLAKQAQVFFPKMKLSLARFSDRMMFNLERRGLMSGDLPIRL
jgi:glycosyltransferase involved in cell wall biosynthesis